MASPKVPQHLIPRELKLEICVGVGCTSIKSNKFVLGPTDFKFVLGLLLASRILRVVLLRTSIYKWGVY